MLSSHNQGTTVVDVTPARFRGLAKNEPSSALHYHFVFSANLEIDLLTPGKREKLHRFIAGCVRIMSGSVKAVGGKNESVHLLVSLNIAQNPADFAGKLKLLSASWAKRNLEMADFAWYDEEVSTVSQSQCNYLSRRIERQ